MLPFYFKTNFTSLFLYSPPLELHDCLKHPNHKISIPIIYLFNEGQMIVYLQNITFVYLYVPKKVLLEAK